VFGGSAWTFDEATGQYYLHSYLREQPDLNWRNPEVERAMLEVMRFWLQRGVHGFRIDAISRVIKDDEFRDNPPNPDYRPGQAPFRQFLTTYSADRPEVQRVIARMREVADEYGDVVLIGEAYLPASRLAAYYGEGRPGLHFPFNFQLIKTPWDAGAIGAMVGEYESGLAPGLWPNWVLGNHDNHRVATRIGPARARLAAMLLLTLRGTPILYYGDEIGMADVPIPPEAVRDPWEKNVPGLGLGRDPERTPMQWDAGPQAGFSAATPWLPLAEDYRQVNVAVHRDDPGSILSLYRRLLAIRAAHPTLCAGRWCPLPSPDGELLVYRREAGDEQFLVALNFSHQPRTIDLGSGGAKGSVALSTLLDRSRERVDARLSLRGDEGLLIALE
jgi:alpha-glucosidase